MRHGECANLMFPRIATCLALDLPAGTARADARIALRKVAGERVAPLDHEVRDDAMKFHAVVKPRVGQLLEVLDGLGRVPIIQLGADGAAIGLEGCSLQRRLRTGSRPRIGYSRKDSPAMGPCHRGLFGRLFTIRRNGCCLGSPPSFTRALPAMLIPHRLSLLALSSAAVSCRGDPVHSFTCATPPATP